MVDPRDALKGRDDAMKIGEKHYVLGGQLCAPFPDGLDVVVLANGCFWGSEKGMWRLPGGGIYSTAVGYVAGYTPNPTYEEVCSGMTGHTEAVQIVYDPELISLVDILRWFWQSHDPCAGMGQGNDRGTQYRSGAYYADEEQRLLMEASREAYSAALAAAGKKSTITTEIAPLTTFYYAENYHQQYLAKPGARPYCSAVPLQVSLPPYTQWAPAGLKYAGDHAPRLPEAFWEKHAPSPHCVIRSPNAPIDVATYAKPAQPTGGGGADGASGQDTAAADGRPASAQPAAAKKSTLGWLRRALFGGASPPRDSQTPSADTPAAPLMVVGPVAGDESLMAPKAHGTSETGVQPSLRFGCDNELADRICNYNRHYAENSNYFQSTGLVRELHRAEREGDKVQFYDSNSGGLLFVAPQGRTFEKFLTESKKHGWPSFRDAEVNWERVRILPDGECVSVDGTHLGHNIPDGSGNRYCINLVSVAGHAAP